MKVKELIAQLSKLSPELEVLCYSEDAALVAPGHGFRLLDIGDVRTVDGEKVRGNADKLPSLKIGKTPSSITLVTIDVTSDF